MNDRQNLLRQINTQSFVMHELHLFLDTHPNDTAAMALLDRHRKQRVELMAEYERKYGPLNIYNVTSDNQWQWIANPWPWDYESEA